MLAVEQPLYLKIKVSLLCPTQICMTERARLQVALSMRRQRESSYILQNFNHIGSICIYTYCPTEKQKNDIWDELPAFLQFLLVKQYLIC